MHVIQDRLLQEVNQVEMEVNKYKQDDLLQRVHGQVVGKRLHEKQYRQRGKSS